MNGAAILFFLIAQRPEFEVATVKLSPRPKEDAININLGTARNGKVALTNATLSDCIKFAYTIPSDAQLAGPDWIRSGATRYDIVAQAPSDTPRESLLLMLQQLLGERMKLVLHREPRELRYLALMPAKNGARLQPSKPDAVPNGPALPGRIVSPQMSMPTLVKLLSRFERQTVLDQTGLDGTFDIHLEWTPDNKSEGNAPSLYTALQQQLGLKLESRKGPAEVLVVDSAEKIPTGN